MAASVDLPWDFALSGKFLYQSPQPLRALVSTAQPFERDVVTGVAKGNGDRWGKRQMDVAITKYVGLQFLNDEARLRFRIDIINLFNDRNYITYIRNPSAPPHLELSNFPAGGKHPPTPKTT